MSDNTPELEKVVRAMNEMVTTYECLDLYLNPGDVNLVQRAIVVLQNFSALFSQDPEDNTPECISWCRKTGTHLIGSVNCDYTWTYAHGVRPNEKRNK